MISLMRNQVNTSPDDAKGSDSILSTSARMGAAAAFDWRAPHAAICIS